MLEQTWRAEDVAKLLRLSSRIVKDRRYRERVDLKGVRIGRTCDSAHPMFRSYSRLSERE